MTNAPERIWIEGAVSNEVWKHDKQSCLIPHEYTRTDLIAAMIDEAVQAEREACAAWCETHAVQSLSPSAIPTPMGDAGWSHVGMKYAAAIRARKGGEA
jgi:hypothetical protein